MTTPGTAPATAPGSRTGPQFGRLPTQPIRAGLLRGLAAADIGTYAVICAFADRHWSCELAADRMAAMTGRSRRTCYRAIGRLVARGLLAVESGGGRHRPNRYRIITGGPQNSDKALSHNTPETVTELCHTKRAKQCHSAPETVTNRAKNSDKALSPLQSKTQRVFRERRAHPPQNDDNTEAKASDDRPGEASDTGSPSGGCGTSGGGVTSGDGIWLPTTGKPWHLTPGLRDRLRDEYPLVDVDGELSSLAAWLKDNPERRKSPGSMAGWLRRCLARKQAERPLSSPAYYPGHFRLNLPTDPTEAELDQLLADTPTPGTAPGPDDEQGGLTDEL